LRLSQILALQSPVPTKDAFLKDLLCGEIVQSTTIFVAANTCAYCGTSNEESLQFCHICGKELPLPDEERRESQSVASDLVPEPQALNGGRATKILLAYIGAQIFAAILGGVLLSSIGDGSERIHLACLGATAIFVFLVGGVVFFRDALMLARPILRDTTDTGAAWVLGSLKRIAQGFTLGVCIGGFYLTLAPILLPTKTSQAGPLSSMAATSGLPQIEWLVCALLLAPPIEELLFRGILFAGFNRSFGTFRAALLTTGIFSLLHIPQTIFYPPSFIAVVAMAFAALWVRLRCRAIGPAIGVHFGYNAVLALAVIASNT
jgi:membrane protease YdiL (CAAX protease family)